MSNILAILLNGVAQLEYYRDRPLPDHQALHLDKMDQKMDDGIELGEQSIANPDQDQRAQFIAANLVHALKTANETQAGALCTYLANRLPDLKQVKIVEDGNAISIDFVFDEDYKKQVAVAVPQLH